MEQQKQLVQYIRQQIQSGVTADEIAVQLRGAGWPENLIVDSFAEVRQSLQPQIPSPAPDEPPATEPADISPAADEPAPQQIPPELEPASQQPSPDAEPLQPLQATGTRRGKFKTSWLLLKQTATVFTNNKQLLKYPAMSLLFNALVLFAFGAIIIYFHDVFLEKTTTIYGDDEYNLTNAGLVIGFFYYVIANSVLYFFTAALTAHILDIFKGQSKPLSEYLKLAQSKLLTIVSFAILATTVGMILRFIEQRFRFVGFLVSKLIGLAWALANLFTLAVIVESDATAPTAIKKSSQLFISRWGENILSRAGFGLATFFIYLGIITVVTVFMMTATILLGVGGLLVSLVLVVLVILVLALIESTLSTILNTALYFYTKYDQIPAAFTRDMLNSVLIPKKSK